MPEPAGAERRRMHIAARLWRGLRWYLRELTGETQYDRYLERHAREHGDVPPLSRREFERRRIAERDAKPGSRCC